MGHIRPAGLVWMLLLGGCSGTFGDSSQVKHASPRVDEKCPKHAPLAHPAKDKCGEEVVRGYLEAVQIVGARYWQPEPSMREIDPTGHRYGGRALRAIVAVKVDSQGFVRQSDISQSCGLQTMDGTALEAFRPGRPLPIPPSCLLESGVFQFKVGLCLELKGAEGS